MELVGRWNAAHAVGAAVTVELDSGEIVATRTRSQAQMLGGEPAKTIQVTRRWSGWRESPGATYSPGCGLKVGTDNLGALYHPLFDRAPLSFGEAAPLSFSRRPSSPSAPVPWWCAGAGQPVRQPWSSCARPSASSARRRSAAGPPYS